MPKQKNSPILDPEVLMTPQEVRSEGRRTRLHRITKDFNVKPGPSTFKLKNRISSKSSLEFVPSRVPEVLTDAPKSVLSTSLGLIKSSGFKKKVEEETDLLAGYWGYHGMIEPEYDLLEPYTLLDTESYYRQSIERRLSLMFRNGFIFTGENTNWVNYIEKRFSQAAYVTGIATENLFRDILFNLLVCSNCILLKIRDKEASGGVKNEKNGNLVPVAGWVICPPNTIFPWLDGYGQVEKWRRFFGSGRPWKDYAVEDVIHFKWNVKPGHLYGTPSTAPVRDDILALRRLEENVELLLIQHLFPLIHVQVGTEEAPCEYNTDGTSEVDVYRNILENMPKEGVLVTDERVKVSVVGVANQGADYKYVLDHYKQRTITGLGMSPLDMGETDKGGSNSTAENISQNLKDAVKTQLAWFGNLVKHLLLKDLFQEAQFYLSIQNALNDVRLEFHELDPDTQIKMETHAANVFNNNGTTQDEFRRALKKKPMTKEEEAQTHHGKHVVSQVKDGQRHEKTMAVLNHELAMEGGAGPKKKTTVSKSKSATGTVTQKKTVEEPVKGAAASAKARIQPSNQYGTNTGPHKAKSGREMLEIILDQLTEVRELSMSGGLVDVARWKTNAEPIFEQLFPGPDNKIIRSRMMTAIRLSSDIDLLDGLIYSVLPDIPVEEEGTNS